MRSCNEGDSLSSCTAVGLLHEPGTFRLSIETFESVIGPAPFEFCASHSVETDVAEVFRDPRLNMLQIEVFFFSVRTAVGESLALLRGEPDATDDCNGPPSLVGAELERRKY